MSPPVELTAAGTTQILTAIERLDGKVDGILQHQAALVEWRKHVEAEHGRHEARLGALEEGDRERELSIVRVTAWAAGAGSIVSILVSIGVAVLIKVLTGH